MALGAQVRVKPWSCAAYAQGPIASVRGIGAPSPLHQKPNADERDKNGDEEHNSKTHAHRKDPRRFIPVQIEYVSCEIYFLIGETHEQSALDIDVGLVGPCSLAYQAESKPIHW